MKFVKIAALAGSLALTGHAMAAVKCPSVSALKGEGLTNTAMVYPYFFLDYHMSTYDTQNNWLFAVGPIQSENEEIALEKGNELLPELIGNPSPVEDKQGNVSCTYTLGDSNDYMAVAFLDGSIDVMKRQLHK